MTLGAMDTSTKVAESNPYGPPEPTATAPAPAPAREATPARPPLDPPPVDGDYDVAVDLYKTYMATFLHAFGFYIALNGATFTFAFSQAEVRQPFIWAGLGLAVVAALPLQYAGRHAGDLEERISLIAGELRRNAMDAAPLRVLITYAAVFWMLVTAMWIFLLLKY